MQAENKMAIKLFPDVQRSIKVELLFYSCRKKNAREKRVVQMRHIVTDRSFRAPIHLKPAYRG